MSELVQDENDFPRGKENAPSLFPLARSETITSELLINLCSLVGCDLTMDGTLQRNIRLVEALLEPTFIRSLNVRPISITYFALDSLGLMLDS